MVFRLALAWGMTPREVLARISSEDLAEWIAFERAHGPIDATYERVMLNSIEFQLQTLNHLMGGAYFTNPDDGENPIAEPKQLPLPWDMATKEQSDGWD